MEETDIEQLFKPYTINFKLETDEEVKKNIEFVMSSLDECFKLFQALYNTHYGTIRIEENLISIHTGGWSDNEEIISEFQKTYWWERFWKITKTGGHYFFDTKDGEKEWKIVIN